MENFRIKDYLKKFVMKFDIIMCFAKAMNLYLMGYKLIDFQKKKKKMQLLEVVIETCKFQEF